MVSIRREWGTASGCGRRVGPGRGRVQLLTPDAPDGVERRAGGGAELSGGVGADGVASGSVRRDGGFPRTDDVTPPRTTGRLASNWTTRGSAAGLGFGPTVWAFWAWLAGLCFGPFF